MTIKTISYSQSRESISSIGLKRWDKYEAEAELMEGDSPELAAQVLKEFVEKVLGANYAIGVDPYVIEDTHLIPGATVTVINRDRDSSIKDSKTLIISQMNECSTHEQLLSYKILCDSNPELKEAYTRKYGEILNSK
jgi:hypothetical protein